MRLIFDDWVFHDVNPIFIQLGNKLKKAILSDKISAGTKLPTIRSAETLKISSNTVAKAYADVCRENLICHQKNGSYIVTQDTDYIVKAREDTANLIGFAYFNAMFELGYTKQEAVAVIQDFLKKGH